MFNDKKVWNKLDKIKGRLVLIVATITSLTFLIPIIKNVVATTREYAGVFKKIIIIEQNVDNALNYFKVVNGILKSITYTVDNKDYGVYLDKRSKEEKLVEVKLRKTRLDLTADYIVFVLDGQAEVYSAKF